MAAEDYLPYDFALGDDWYDEHDDYHGPTNSQEAMEISSRGIEIPYKRVKEILRMAPKNLKNKKPILVKVGPHFINPVDVSSIRAVQLREDTKTVYVVDFISRPNPEYTCWIKKDEIETLLSQFQIIEED